MGCIGSRSPRAQPLHSLGLAAFHYVPGRGRFSTLWSSTDYQEPEPAVEETAALEEFLPGGTLVRIVRTFEPFPEPMQNRRNDLGLNKVQISSALAVDNHWELFRLSRISNFSHLPGV